MTKKKYAKPEAPWRVAGFVECPRCGIERDLIEDGDRQDDGEIEWSGCAEATCCGLLIADWWEGTFVYELEARISNPPENASEVHQYDGSRPSVEEILERQDEYAKRFEDADRIDGSTSP